MSKFVLVGMLAVLDVGAVGAQSVQPATPPQAWAAQPAPASVTRAWEEVVVGKVDVATPRLEFGSSRADAALIRNVAGFRSDGPRAGGKGALIGAALGSMLGAAFASARCEHGIDSCAGAFYIGAVAGALPGAGVGALIGHQYPRGVLAQRRGSEGAGDR